MTHIEKMKQWLEALEEAVHYTSAPVWSPSMTKECNEAIASLRQAIAEAEKQEPVAWVNHGENRITRVTGWDGYGALFATPPQRTEQEPVIDKSAAIRIATALGWEPKREWVGLTDEQIDEIWRTHLHRDSRVRAIEAKLKQKNGYAEENA